MLQFTKQMCGGGGGKRKYFFYLAPGLLELCLATTTSGTYICLIWDQTFTNLDV